MFLRGPCKLLLGGGLVAVLGLFGLAQCVSTSVDNGNVAQSEDQPGGEQGFQSVEVAWDADSAYVRYGEDQQVAVDFQLVREHAEAGDVDAINDALEETSSQIDHALAIRRDDDGTWVLVVDGTEYRPPGAS